MKLLHNNLLVLDRIDILCLSISAGSSLGLLVRLYRNYKRTKIEDPIIAELKEKSPITVFSEKGKPLKLPVVRGGEEIKGVLSILIKNKKLSNIVTAIITARKKQKQLRLLREFLLLFNLFLSASFGFGIKFEIGSSSDYVNLFLIAFPATATSFLVALKAANSIVPMLPILGPLAFLFSRGMTDIPDPYEKCRVLCKVAENFHNRQIRMEMKNFNSLVEEAAKGLQLPIDKVPLLCVEEKLSLVERYRLKEVAQTGKLKKRIQHFSKFIKKFPECNADPEVFKEIVKEKIKVLNE